jgi:serine/threonine-protein kinase
MECLDESTVLELLEGRLPSGDADRRRRHLAACNECRSLVANVAKSLRSDAHENAETTLAAGVGEPDFQAHFAPGTILDGRYRVERVLGSGGMGVVALATHTELDHKVALKLLHPRALSSPEAVSRFVREAKAAARAFGDHVVRVLDVARLESGEPYIAMELLEGKDARALREERMPSVDELVDIVAQACIGVAHAHRAGVVHRDLKPANLFVLDEPSRSPPLLVKVLDFGVSKIRRDDLGSDVSLTRSSAFLGTPLYMAPEQIKTARDVDARADVWALGCILHELATGVAPFRRPSLGETCAAILVEDPPRLPSSIPRPLAAIVARCLAKDPNDRYADAAALAGALAPLCSPGTREEIARTLGIEVTKEARKRPIWPWAALVTVLAAGAFAMRGRPEPASVPMAAKPTPTVETSVSTTVVHSEPAKSVAPSAVAIAPVPIVSKPIAKPAPSPTIVPSASGVAPVVSAAPSASAPPLNPEFGGRI